MTNPPEPMENTWKIFQLWKTFDGFLSSPKATLQARFSHTPNHPPVYGFVLTAQVVTRPFRR